MDKKKVSLENYRDTVDFFAWQIFEFFRQDIITTLKEQYNTEELKVIADTNRENAEEAENGEDGQEHLRTIKAMNDEELRKTLLQSKNVVLATVREASEMIKESYIVEENLKENVEKLYKKLIGEQ